MNLIDGVIRAFSPVAALERAKARTLLARIDKMTGFRRNGAQSTTNRKAASSPLTHPDSRSNHTDRVQLIREARELEENSAVIKSILRKYRTFAVGRLQYIATTSNEEANKQINAYVSRWMKQADRTGRHHFRTLAGLGVTSMKRDGDIGFIVTEVPLTRAEKRLKVSPIRIQAIEADRIGAVVSFGGNSTKQFEPLAQGEQDFSGVVVNENGVPLRYRIYNRSADGGNFTPATEVPAQDFIHVFDPTRIDGYRSFSAFDAAIDDIKDAQEIIGFEKIGVKFLCSKAGTVTNATGEAPDDVLLDTDHADYNADAARLKTINPGQIDYLMEGEKFEPIDMDRPSPTFNGFFDTLIRLTGLSLNLPFGFI